jgi:hypothetical protein
MDMRFEVWNVRSLCKPGSLKTAANESATYILARVQEVRWDKGGTEQAED